MRLGPRARSFGLRFSGLRYRRWLIACLITVLISGSLLALIGIARWHGHRALETDTRSIVSQTAQQLVRALNSRRGTLTLIRDTLNRRGDLTAPQRRAMGLSAAAHTRHLIGTGMIRAAEAPVWWSDPAGLAPSDAASLTRAIAQHAKRPGTWRVASTFALRTKTQRTLLVMLEPLRAASSRHSAVFGVFDVTPLLEDFFTSSLSQRHPVQLSDGGVVLYRSKDWLAATAESRPIIEEQPLAVDTARWTLQMEPGSTHVIQTLSWFSVLLIGLSVVAGVGVTIVVWLLAARTWILQRAVTRRTAALRRTLKRLRQLATTDELTGLHNRRFFLNRWEWECERAKRYQRPLACLMVDVNGFKQVNDRLGHYAGDLVLKQVAEELKAALRQSDILARFGGDEFIVALPETSLAQASAVAEKLRQVNIAVPGGAERRIPPVRLSVGLSRIEQTDESPTDILHAADQSLYASKQRTTPTLLSRP